MIENEKSVSDNTDVENCFNIFFSNIFQNIEVRKYEVKESFHQNIKKPTLKAVLKYRNHPSMTSMLHSFHQALSFNFSYIDRNTVLKEIINLNATKASQDIAIPLKTVTEYADYFAEFICI